MCLNNKALFFCLHEHVILAECIILFGGLIVVLNLIILINQSPFTTTNKAKKMRQDHNEITEFFFFLFFWLLAFLGSLFDFQNAGECGTLDSYIIHFTVVVLLIDCILQFAVFCAYDPTVHLYRFGASDQARKNLQVLKGIVVVANSFWNSFLVLYLIFLPWKLSGLVTLDRLADAGRLAFRLHAAVCSYKNVYKMIRTYTVQPQPVAVPKVNEVVNITINDLR